MWHCFFEQSGTFKRSFIRNGEQAEDYDILKNGKTIKVNKSLISQTYADYFVDTFIFGTK